MRESDIERYLLEEVSRLRGVARKVVYQGRRGSPDRWCIFPGGRIVLIELKTPGKKPSALQQDEIETLRNLGMRVEVVDSKERVDEVLSGI